MQEQNNLNPSQIGLITEYKCITYLLEKGFNVLKPEGNYTKYDLVIEKNNRFYRIQCKHAIPDIDSFRVRTWYSIRSSSIKQKYTKDDCDYFMTEYQNIFYMFPLFNTVETKFWLKETINKNSKKAKDYEADKILEKL
jgi:hypothetical protein